MIGERLRLDTWGGPQQTVRCTRGSEDLAEHAQREPEEGSNKTHSNHLNQYGNTPGGTPALGEGSH